VYLVTALVAGALVIAGCGSNDESEAADDGGLRPIRVGAPSLNLFLFADLHAADRAGFFEKYGLDAELIDFSGQGAQGAIAAMAGGSLDFGVFGPDALVVALVNGVKVSKVIADGPWSTASLVVSPDITSFEDLRGKKVAISSPDSGSTLVAVEMLKKNGLTTDDVELVTTGGTSDRYAALTAGQVSAAVMSQPQDLVAEEEGYSILGIAIDELGPFSYSSHSASEDVDEDTRVRYVAAIRDAQAWLYANPDEATEMLADVTGIEPDLAAKTYDFLFKKYESMPTDARVQSEAFNAVLDALRDTNPDVGQIDDYVDMSYLDEANERFPSE